MKRMMDECMVKSPYMIDPAMALQEAFETMRDSEIRHLPVVEDEKLVGILSERELRAALALEQAKLLKVRDIMKTDVVAVQQDASLGDVVDTMLDLKVGSIVVTDRRNDVVGIFTTTDALRILSEYLGAEIEDRVLETEDFESWLPSIGEEQERPWAR